MSERDDRFRSMYRAERMLGCHDTGTFSDLTEEDELERALDLEAIRYRAEGGLNNPADNVSSSANGNVIVVDFSRNAKLKDGE